MDGDVTFGFQVQFVVQIFVDFSCLTVLFQKTTKDTDATNPQHFEWNSGVGGTLAFTFAGVASLGFGRKACFDARTGMNDDRFANNKTIFVQFANVLTRIGHGDVVDFVWVQPDFAHTTFKDGCRQTFLKFSTRTFLIPETFFNFWLPNVLFSVH